MGISPQDRRYILAKSAGRCNKCKTNVFIENEFGERARLADDAHIYAESDFGPRANLGLSTRERNDPSNLILLCKLCHSEIDQQPLKYHHELVRSIRDSHYAWVDERLGQLVDPQPRFHYLIYVNMPRVDMYAAVHSIPLPNVDLGSAQSFRDLGMKAGQVMARYTKVLNSEELYATPLSRLNVLDSLDIGSYYFLSAENFRTKNIDRHADLTSKWARDEGIAYLECGAGWRLICLIDPRWITTSTAFATLRRGSAKMSCVLHMNAIDHEKKYAITSPLFLAEPKPEFAL